MAKNASNRSAPLAIAHADGALGGADDVDEQDGGEDSSGVDDRAGSGDEVLDLVDDGVGVPREEGVVRSRQLHILGVRDPIGQIPPVGGWGELVTDPWRTRVGTRTAESTERTSTFTAIRMSARAVPGLAADRSNFVIHLRNRSSAAIDGAMYSTSSPCPHAAATPSTSGSRASLCQPTGYSSSA